LSQKNGVEISRDEIPAEIQQQLNLIQQQIDEGKAKIETVENTGKIENTNKEIKSEINKEG
jgi:ribose 1,5-bisphosphokinase PhnN